LDLRDLAIGIQLSCRFTYQLPHFFPRFQDEIRRCVTSRPDFLIVERDSFVSADPQVRVVLRTYTACRETNEFMLYGRNGGLCTGTV
jgi:hypothetical protein